MLIQLKDLVKKYQLRPKGVLHMGANYGQEAADYLQAGIKHVWWVEAIPEVFYKLRSAMEKYSFDTVTCSNLCLSDIDGQEVVFNITNNDGQSSSLLEFGTHATAHPTVKVVDSIKLTTTRFDTYINSLLYTENGDAYEIPVVNMGNYDMLNIDLQGAELMALRGMGEYLARFKYVYIEVNEKELYKGCPMVCEIDGYLGRYGFQRVETKMTGWGWGDAFYTRKK
jgi:FkbM family methyltransferase